LDNSSRYSAIGDSIALKGEQLDRDVRIVVEDYGEGIPEEDLPHVFERFYRVDKVRTRTHGGNGLGLSIAKQIVDAYGGQIQIQSELKKGTTVLLTLPGSESTKG
jgi:signal transduction histidine kinase